MQAPPFIVSQSENSKESLTFGVKSRGTVDKRITTVIYYQMFLFVLKNCRYNFNMDKGPVNIEWFIGAQTNLAYNCLDRHIEAGQGDKIAFYFEGNDIGQIKLVSNKPIRKESSAPAVAVRLSKDRKWIHYQGQDILWPTDEY